MVMIRSKPCWARARAPNSCSPTSLFSRILVVMFLKSALIFLKPAAAESRKDLSPNWPIDMPTFRGRFASQAPAAGGLVAAAAGGVVGWGAVVGAAAGAQPASMAMIATIAKIFKIVWRILFSPSDRDCRMVFSFGHVGATRAFS